MLSPCISDSGADTGERVKTFNFWPLLLGFAVVVLFEGYRHRWIFASFSWLKVFRIGFGLFLRCKLCFIWIGFLRCFRLLSLGTTSEGGNVIYNHSDSGTNFSCNHTNLAVTTAFSLPETWPQFWQLRFAGRVETGYSRDSLLSSHLNYLVSCVQWFFDTLLFVSTFSLCLHIPVSSPLFLFAFLWPFTNQDTLFFCQSLEVRPADGCVAVTPTLRPFFLLGKWNERYSGVRTRKWRKERDRRETGTWVLNRNREGNEWNEAVGNTIN